MNHFYQKEGISSDRMQNYLEDFMAKEPERIQTEYPEHARELLAALKAVNPKDFKTSFPAKLTSLFKYFLRPMRYQQYLAQIWRNLKLWQWGRDGNPEVLTLGKILRGLGLVGMALMGLGLIAVAFGVISISLAGMTVAAGVTVGLGVLVGALAFRNWSREISARNTSWLAQQIGDKVLAEMRDLLGPEANLPQNLEFRVAPAKTVGRTMQVLARWDEKTGRVVVSQDMLQHGNEAVLVGAIAKLLAKRYGQRLAGVRGQELAAQYARTLMAKYGQASKFIGPEMQAELAGLEQHFREQFLAQYQGTSDPVFLYELGYRAVTGLGLNAETFKETQRIKIGIVSPYATQGGLKEYVNHILNGYAPLIQAGLVEVEVFGHTTDVVDSKDATEKVRDANRVETVVPMIPLETIPELAPYLLELRKMGAQGLKGIGELIPRILELREQLNLPAFNLHGIDLTGLFDQATQEELRSKDKRMILYPNHGVEALRQVPITFENGTTGRIPIRINRATTFNVGSASIKSLVKAVADRGIDITNFQWLITSSMDGKGSPLGILTPASLQRLLGVPTTVTAHHSVHTMNLIGAQKIKSEEDFTGKLVVVGGSELFERSLGMITQKYALMNRNVDTDRDLYGIRDLRMHHGFFKLEAPDPARFTADSMVIIGTGGGKFGDYKRIEVQIAAAKRAFEMDPTLRGRALCLVSGGDNPNVYGYTESLKSKYKVAHALESIPALQNRPLNHKEAQELQALRDEGIEGGVLVIEEDEVMAFINAEKSAGRRVTVESYRRWMLDRARTETQRSGVQIDVIYRPGFINNDEFPLVNGALDISLGLYSTTGASGPAHEAAGLGKVNELLEDDERFNDNGQLSEEGMANNLVSNLEEAGATLVRLVNHPQLRWTQAVQNWKAGRDLIPEAIARAYFYDFRHILGQDNPDIVVGKLARGMEQRGPPANFRSAFVIYVLSAMVVRGVSAGLSALRFALGSFKPFAKFAVKNIQFTQNGQPAVAAKFDQAWENAQAKRQALGRWIARISVSAAAAGLSFLALMAIGAEGRAQFLMWGAQSFETLKGLFVHYNAQYRITLTTVMAVVGNAIQDFVGQKLGKRPQYNWQQTLFAALLGATVGVQIALLNIFIDWSLPQSGLINSGLLRLYHMNGIMSAVSSVFIHALRGLAVPIFGLLISLEYGLLTMVFGKNLKQYTVKDQALKAVDFNVLKAPFALAWGYFNQNIVRSVLRGPFQIIYDMAWGFVQAWAFNRTQPLREVAKALLFRITKNQRFCAQGGSQHRRSCYRASG